MENSHSQLDGAWFREEIDMADGYSLSIKVDKVLYQEKSQYQDILVFQSTQFGKVLVLNGAIQCTERDEFAYQEMIAHLPLNTHPNPQRVLVVGGGDGGVVREVLKYDTVTEVVLCEIDQEVIDVCRKFLPIMAACLDDPRVTISVGDGIAYVKNKPEAFDVIITDSPDPYGCAEGLFQKEFYGDVRRALKPNGVACFQGESTWFDIPLIKRMLVDCRSLFPTVAYATGYTPTYAGGQMGDTKFSAVTIITILAGRASIVDGLRLGRLEAGWARLQFRFIPCQPDYILNIALKKSAGEIPHDKIRFLLENAVRVMVQNAQLQNLEDGGKVQHVVVKTRAECYSLMEDLHTLFPEHTHVFMNREIFATIQSYRTLLKQHPSLAFRLADSDLVAAFTGAFRQNLFNYCFFPTLEDKAVVSDLVPHLSVAGILSATTACQMSATEKLQKKGLPIYHLSYDELMEDPRRVVTGLFQRLGLSEDHVTRALRAMEVRSQRAVLPAVATEKLTEKDVCDIARVMGRYQVNVDNGR
nr:hypothetical protein BaRGS_007690 [Batillaria attramentaria]